jgi:hypothetical protein
MIKLIYLQKFLFKLIKDYILQWAWVSYMPYLQTNIHGRPPHRGITFNFLDLIHGLGYLKIINVSEDDYTVLIFIYLLVVYFMDH